MTTSDELMAKAQGLSGTGHTAAVLSVAAAIQELTEQLRRPATEGMRHIGWVQRDTSEALGDIRFVFAHGHEGSLPPGHEECVPVWVDES